ncbi:hypothetical protein AAG570_012148 [Ranatra chinensis]|uniref:Ubiquitin carboxyl-terminal hydrolase n=1 Tax=Ranatra chinensis TaxID=642074 RepID=A0ABD0YI40_9HEMI
MIPRPVVALILLFPCSETYEKLKAEQETELTEKGQTISDEVYFLKQVISNACGTIALIHSVANNQEEIQLGDGPLKQFLEDTKSMTPDERGAMLMKNEGIASDHNEIAVEGQTQAPPENEPVNHHFVAFVQKEGSLYELDGRKAFPINHGSSNPDTFVEVIEKIMLRLFLWSYFRP